MVGRPHVMRGPIKLFVAALAGALLALPAGAYAQSSSEGGYNQPGGVVQDEIQAQPTSRDATSGTPARQPADSSGTPAGTPAGTPVAAAAADEGGNLPFTGFDLALIVAAGGVLLMLGFGIRRATRASAEVA